MKILKVLGVLLITASILVIPHTAFAEDIVDNAPTIEDFSLHSGTMFGDTPDEVKAKEEADGSAILTGDMIDNTWLFYEGSFEGIDDSRLRYGFTNDDKTLYMSSCIFRICDKSLYRNEDNQIDEFEHITDELTLKYGEPFYNDSTGTSFKNGEPFYDDSTGTPFIYDEYYSGSDTMTTGFSYCQWMRDNLGGMYADLKLLKYNQWLIKADDDKYVLIDHYIMMEDDDINHTLSYVVFDEGTVRSALETDED